MKRLSKWISKSNKEIQIYMNAEFKEYGINKTDYIYLIHVTKIEGINQEEIAKELSITKTAGSKIVKKLIDLDLIERKRNIEDKRAFELYSKEKGRILKEILDKKVEAWENKIFESYKTEEDVQEIFDKIIKFYEVTKKLNEDRV